MPGLFGNSGGALTGRPMAQSRPTSAGSGLGGGLGTARTAPSGGSGLFGGSDPGGSALGQGDRGLWGDRSGWGTQAAANNPFGDAFSRTRGLTPFGDQWRQPMTDWRSARPAPGGDMAAWQGQRPDMNDMRTRIASWLSQNPNWGRNNGGQ
jgi:hypothetical protein